MTNALKIFIQVSVARERDILLFLNIQEPNALLLLSIINLLGEIVLFRHVYSPQAIVIRISVCVSISLFLFENSGKVISKITRICKNILVRDGTKSFLHKCQVEELGYGQTVEKKLKLNFYNVRILALQTFQNVDHDVSLLGVARGARVIATVAGLGLLDLEYRACFGELDPDSGFGVVVYHAGVTVPEHVERRLGGRHQLTLEP